MRHHTDSEFWSLREKIIQHNRNESSQSRSSASCHALNLQEPFDVVFFLCEHSKQVLKFSFALITMNIASISPVVTTSILLHKTQFFVVSPVSGGVEIFHNDFWLHIDLKCFCFPLFGFRGVKKCLEHGLMPRRGSRPFIIHNVIKVSSDLVATLAKLYNRKRHNLIFKKENF